MTALGAPRTRSIVMPAALVVGLAAAVELRLAVGGVAVRDSASAGIAFAAALAALTVAAGKFTAPMSTPAYRPAPPLQVLVAGATGAAVLCMPVVTRIGSVAHHRPAGNYIAWSLVVAVVAISEEAFLRGMLYRQVEQASGGVVAVITTSACFAALHVPIYGWRAGGLDLAVGLWLGALRYVTRTWHAPAVAHVAADLAGWWLR
jgi:membrane protease YdiL (CAAX protease family)